MGLDLVGVVLMAALLITPAAAARYWTNDLPRMILLSSFFGACSGAFGVVVSFYAPKMPTGPWIVVFATAFLLVSLLIAPERGVIARRLRHRSFQRKIREENLLRALFRFEEDGISAPHSLQSIVQIRPTLANTLDATISALERLGELTREPDGLRLTREGLARAERVTRYHRLWEVYLSRMVNIPSHMLHEGAENVEHLLTEEMESELLLEIEGVNQDPHGKPIPQRVEPESGDEK